MRFWRATLASFVLVAGKGFAQAEPAETRNRGLGDAGLVGAVETREGVRQKGIVSIVDSSFRIAAPGAPPLLTVPEDILSLTVQQKIRGNREEAAPVTGALPAPWRNRDLGRTLVPGKVRWRDGAFAVSVSSKAADERFDAFHLVYLPVKGDCEIQARVVRIGNKDKDAYAGIIICDGTTPENRKAVLGVHSHGEKGVNFRRWGYQGGSSTGKEISVLKLPYWVKLVREGYDVTAYHSPDGRRWRMLKVSAGRMRDEQVYVGLAVGGVNSNRLSEAVIDRVSINGEGSAEVEPMLPHVVLRGGSRLAAEVLRANRTAFHLGGRWEGRTITAPQVARVEFFHPLPVEAEPLVEGDRPGLLLRSGDFSEGSFASMEDGKIRIGSVLLGSREHSILDEADCLVLRRGAPLPARYRVETHSGSILLAQGVSLQEGHLVLRVAGLGEARFRLEELKLLRVMK